MFIAKKSGLQKIKNRKFLQQDGSFKIINNNLLPKDYWDIRDSRGNYKYSVGIEIINELAKIGIKIKPCN